MKVRSTLSIRKPPAVPNTVLSDWYWLHHGASLHLEADPVLSLHAITLPVGFSVSICQTAHSSTRILLMTNNQGRQLWENCWLMSHKHLTLQVTVTLSSFLSFLLSLSEWHSTDFYICDSQNTRRHRCWSHTVWHSPGSRPPSLCGHRSSVPGPHHTHKSKWVEHT